jgi:hypothetical protein
MSQDSPYAPAPGYGAAPPPTPSAGDEMSAPPQMSPLQRVGNVFFSPGEVFEDVRRSPRDWWLPILLLFVVGIGANYVVLNRLGFTPELLATSAVDSGLEQQGKTRKDLSEDERNAVEMQENFIEMSFRFAPLVGLLFGAVFYVLAALLYWILLMIAQAKTTFFRVLSVVAYAFFVPNILKSLLQVVLAFLMDPSTADAATYLQTGGVLTASPAALVSMKESPVLWTLLSYVDVFSIWFIALLGIGFAAITVKRLKVGTALAIAAAPYVFIMLVATGFRMLTAR